MIRSLAIVGTLAASILFIQLIWAAYQPTPVLPPKVSTTGTPPAPTVELDQRSLEDLAAWPAASTR